VRVLGWLAVTFGLAGLVIAPRNADAFQFKVLHAFKGNKDGALPTSVPLIGKHGRLYDLTTDVIITREPGKHCSKGCGVATLTTVYRNESTLAVSNDLYGAGPGDSLIGDASGNLYGTSEIGGAYSQGTVYRITPQNKVKVLYSFCPNGGHCVDGAEPVAGVVTDGVGDFYGTTIEGGTGASPAGTVFEVDAGGNEKVLHSFCSSTGCTDGAALYAPVIRDNAGNLYGTTYRGGNGAGVVFKIAPDGTETVLHTFCSDTNCADGSSPWGAVTMDASGNLYGTTQFGGTNNEGTVFRVDPNENESVLYSFCSSTGCQDGAGPMGSALLLDEKGNLYGTTASGGPMVCEGQYYCGTVFKLAPDGTETVLHAFCSTGNCTDGWNPGAGLSMDEAGDLFGTAYFGGHVGSNGCNCGVVFELTR
jgi:uncharacterized repeat protein (TIGR03803 family)